MNAGRSLRRVVSCAVLTALPVLGLAGCGAEDVATTSTPTTTTTAPVRDDFPRRQPDMYGWITSLSPSEGGADDVLGAIAVQALDEGAAGPLGDRANLTVTRSTSIWGCGPGDEPVSNEFNHLLVGQQVGVYVEGPIAESYPVQAVASTITSLCG